MNESAPTSSNSFIPHTDELERRLWNACDDGWWISAAADQWWIVTATCPHGRFEDESRGGLGLAEAFRGVVVAAEAAHA